MPRPPKKKGEIKPIRPENPQDPESDSAVAVEDPPEPPAAPAAPKFPGPFKRKAPNPVQTQTTFMDRVAGIARDDWGTRAKIKVYRIEPIIDRTRGSEFKFITIYHEPIEENKLKMDHGSGRYRLYLNMKTAGQTGDKEIDMVEIDILDPNFPPKIAAGEWVDDPRNKKWAWARATIPQAPAEAAATAVQQTNSVLEAMRINSEIRKQTVEELKANEPAAEAKVDPFAGAVSLAEKFMSMKADNPMVEIMREELREMRQENRELQKEIRQQQAAPKQAGGIGNLKEIVGTVKDLIPELESIFPRAKEAVSDAVSRGRRPSFFQEVGLQLAPYVGQTIQTITPMFLQLLMQPRQPQQQQPFQQQQNPGIMQPPAIAAPQPNGQPPAQQQRQLTTLLEVIGPTIFNYFDTQEKPEDLADWITDGFGEEALTAARQVTAPNLLIFFKRLPEWGTIAAREPQFLQYMEAVLHAKEEEESEGPIDLSEDEGEAANA